MSRNPARARATRRTLALGLLFSLGCTRVDRQPAQEAARTSPQSAARRIVALTVGAVDSLALLGQLGRVVAVEEDCFVPGTEELIKIRNDDHAGPSRALNVEAVLALDPDLVIAKEDLRSALGGRGVRVLWLPSSSGLQTILPMIEQLGRELDAADKAREVMHAMRASMDAIAAQVAPLARVRVYYEAGRMGRTAGRGTVIDDMIRLAGGENIAGEMPLANPVLNAEAILAADPEVIVLSPWCDSPETIAARPGWNHIAAVRAGRIHQIPERDRKLQYPSPSCVDGCRRMLVPWLHPELARAQPEGN